MLVVGAVALGGCSRAGRPAGRLALRGDAAALLPEDDGAQLVLLYGSEVLGSIDGCGCMGNPRLGGLPYRSAFAEGLRSARPDVAVLQLDAGASMADVRNTAGAEVADFVVQDEWTATALDRLGYDAVNLTAREIPFLARYLRDGEWEKAVAARPALGRFVSANVEPARPGLVGPPPYVVRVVAAPRLGGSVRVAVVGVTEADPKLEGSDGFRVTDPASALARVLPKARAESDLVVVLAYMTAAQADAVLARSGAGADAVIVAHSLSGDAEPRLDAPPRVTYAWYKTQKLGVLQLTVRDGAIAAARNSYVKLDDPLPRDPMVEELVASADAAVRAAKERRFAEATK